MNGCNAILPSAHSVRKTTGDDMSINLFSPLTIGGIELSNRVIMAPMTRSRADDAGLVSDLTVEYYSQRASAGLIISEATYVSPMAKGYVRTPGIANDAQVEAWKKVTEAIHARGGKIFLQIFHTGRIALPDFLPRNATPIAPSSIAAPGENYTYEGMKPFVTPRALEIDEIPFVIEEFGKATERAFLAGFDGVELHAASGYLVHQFLMSSSNRRTDKYGGWVENRSRFLMEILDAMIGVRGSDKIGVKFSPQMPFNGIDEPDAEETYPFILRELSSRGLAYVHVANATPNDWHSKLRPIYVGNYFAGAGLTKETSGQLLAEGKADAAVFGALYVANPDLPARFEANSPLNAPDTSTFYTPGAKGYTDYPALGE